MQEGRTNVEKPGSVMLNLCSERTPRLVGKVTGDIFMFPMSPVAWWLKHLLLSPQKGRAPELCSPSSHGSASASSVPSNPSMTSGGCGR